jgi:hypothetical protein
MDVATRSSWKTLSPPKSCEPSRFEGTFSDGEYQLIRKGVIPKAMEDKWFIFLEIDSLHFHRSWTGAEIYCIRLQQAGDVWRVSDSWVNRDPEQYRGSDLAYERELLRFIIDGLMLRKPATFPLPPGSGAAPAGVVQHTYIGRAFPEKPAPDDE